MIEEVTEPEEEAETETGGGLGTGTGSLVAELYLMGNTEEQTTA